MLNVLSFDMITKINKTPMKKGGLPYHWEICHSFFPLEIKTMNTLVLWYALSIRNQNYMIVFPRWRHSMSILLVKLAVFYYLFTYYYFITYLCRCIYTVLRLLDNQLLVNGEGRKVIPTTVHPYLCGWKKCSWFYHGW